jgi:hypothetical protein
MSNEYPVAVYNYSLLSIPEIKYSTRYCYSRGLSDDTPAAPPPSDIIPLELLD